ncbi:MAG: zinc ribbon domain-containing protein, partial [Anaerolineales bacterium]|nr:zinc ribbon domain-containing protein [Anaerolineales bacterium]
VWDAINDLCALTRALAGERDAPQNPKLCEYCETANDPQLESCTMCGAALPSELPRKCPKCGRSHTSDALFCQACGTRLVDG